MVRVLLAAGAGGLPKGEGGWPRNVDGTHPLALAAEGGHLEVARLLLQAGCPLREANKNGNTAVWVAEGQGGCGRGGK